MTVSHFPHQWWFFSVPMAGLGKRKSLQMLDGKSSAFAIAPLVRFAVNQPVRPISRRLIARSFVDGRRAADQGGLTSMKRHENRTTSRT